MHDRNNLGDSFVTWQREMDSHLEAARFKRLCARVPFIAVICVGLGSMLAHWRYSIVVQHYCLPRTNACAQLDDPGSSWFWAGWGVAVTFGLAVICVAAALVMLVIRVVPRYSRLVRISGPFQDHDRRRQFVCWFWLTMILAIGLLALTIIEFLA